jgi:hypothetical protein
MNNPFGPQHHNITTSADQQLGARLFSLRSFLALGLRSLNQKWCDLVVDERMRFLINRFCVKTSALSAMNMIPKELIPPENRAIVPPAETDPLLEKRSMIRLHAGATHLAVHGLLSTAHSVVHATYIHV